MTSAESAPTGPPVKLRPGLLDGVVVAFAHAPAPAAPRDASALPGAAVPDALQQLGARVLMCGAASQEAPPGDRDAEMERLAAQLLGGAPQLDALVVDGAGMHAAVPAPDALRSCLDGTWTAVRAFANAAFIGPGRPGRVILLAPAPDAGEHAAAALAGLENLARTLSIEWSRHGITSVAIAPGAAGGGGSGARRGGPGEVAALCAYLLSPAGAYFSGCLLDLRGAAGAA